MAAYHTCRYCGGTYRSDKMTKDHLIPKWVLRVYPEFRDGQHNSVKACLGCNGKKGPIPAAEFIRVRRDNSLLRMSTIRWMGIAQVFAKYDAAQLEAGLLLTVREAFLEPVEFRF